MSEDTRTIDAKLSELETKISELKTQMIEMEARVNQNVDKKAAEHDRVTQAHINGIHESMNLLRLNMDDKIDRLDATTKERYESLQSQYGEFKEAMQKRHEDFTSAINGKFDDFKETMQKQHEDFTSAINDKFDDFKETVYQKIDGLAASFKAQNELLQSNIKNLISFQQTMLMVISIVFSILLMSIIAVGGWFISEQQNLFEASESQITVVDKIEP